MKPYELLIWDMDGTLLQTADVVPDSFIQTANEFGVNGYKREDIIKLYNLGVPENMLTHMLGRIPARVEMDFFYSTLEQNAYAVFVYPEIVDCLESTGKHLRSSVFTGASQRSAEILLKATGLTKYFDVVMGGDKYPPKPDPAGILAVVGLSNTCTNKTAYIGDAPTDIKAALAAGVAAFGAGWGHLYKEVTGDNKMFQCPSDLTKYLA